METKIEVEISKIKKITTQPKMSFQASFFIFDISSTIVIVKAFITI